MNSISGINNSTRNSALNKWNNFIRFAKNYAKIIDSRESTYRLALDLSAFDIPTLTAAAFRNLWNFLEALWEGSIGTFMVFAAPKITSLVAKTTAKFILPKEEQKNAINYLRFQMNELENEKLTENGLKRILNEEPKDQERISELYRGINNKKNKVQYYKNKADEIREFCKNFTYTEEKRKNIYKLKRATILGESLIEGGVWGSFGLSLRLFRKYVLRRERFTGTMGYLSDADSNGLGEGGELNLFQRTCGIGTIFLSPILNAILLNKTKNFKTKNNNKFLSIAKSHLDMTHGIYPKLGLLFSYTSIPKWTGIFITSQGWYERVERIFKFFTILPSWWLGHRVTNGVLASNADKKLTGKYKIAPGILVEKEYLKSENTKDSRIMEKLKHLCPEPARIHHVLDAIEEREAEEINQAKNEESKISIKNKFATIRKEAEDLHAKTLYKGFALHSFLVWCVTMLVNYTTKLRVKYALRE